VNEADIRDNHGRLHLIADASVQERLRTKYEEALSLLDGLR
jgi:hypothetical protein